MRAPNDGPASGLWAMDEDFRWTDVRVRRPSKAAIARAAELRRAAAEISETTGDTWLLDRLCALHRLIGLLPATKEELLEAERLFPLPLGEKQTAE